MPLDLDATWMTPKEMAKSYDTFLTVAECAERANVSLSTVRLALRRGELTRYRCGRLIYVSWSEVLRRVPAGQVTEVYRNGRLVRSEPAPVAWHTTRKTAPKRKRKRRSN